MFDYAVSSLRVEKLSFERRDDSVEGKFRKWFIFWKGAAEVLRWRQSRFSLKSSPLTFQVSNTFTFRLRAVAAIAFKTIA